MTDFALSDEFAGRRDAPPPSGPQPVNPPWLRPVATVAIVAVHIAVFAAFILGPKPEPLALSENYVDLESGDFIEQQEVSASEDTPPQEEVQDPELALPPPMVMTPDAIPLPAKREAVEKVEKKKPVEQKEHADQRREAQAARHAGAPEGHGRSGGAASPTCLAHVAASLRSHTPGATSLGAGTAHVTFHVNPGGGISGVSASGSTPGHAALARRIVSSSRGPGSCGSAFVSQGFSFH
ncbi:MAG: energy transducer TonB [Methylocystis sp.]|nr:MAG: energy transducer TonB [Methylocystis sp.]